MAGGSRGALRKYSMSKFTRPRPSNKRCQNRAIHHRAFPFVLDSSTGRCHEQRLQHAFLKICLQRKCKYAGWYLPKITRLWRVAKETCDDGVPVLWVCRGGIAKASTESEASTGLRILAAFCFVFGDTGHLHQCMGMY